jgi:uncharacterized protein with PIN domain
LMEGEGVPSNAWQGLRQHLTQQRHCPSCGRVVWGNAYFRHIRRCTGNPTPARELETESAPSYFPVQK